MRCDAGRARLCLRSITDHAARSGPQPAEVTSGDGANGPSRADTCVLAAALRRGWRPGDGEVGWMEPGRRCFCLGCWGPAKVAVNATAIAFKFFVLLQRAGASACVCRASACICWCLFRREETEKKTEAVDDVINKGIKTRENQRLERASRPALVRVPQNRK